MTSEVIVKKGREGVGRGERIVRGQRNVNMVMKMVICSEDDDSE